jgi:mRNA-degrading endonuclease RelE of RelBE toxin-antitoxin system
MQVFLHHIVEKYLGRLNEIDRERIKAALKGLKKEPPEGNIRPYEGNPGIWRLKVSGGHRALFKIEDGEILVTHIEPRGQAYTKKTRNRRG